MKRVSLAIAKSIGGFVLVIFSAMTTRAIYGTDVVPVYLMLMLALMAAALSFVWGLLSYRTDGAIIVDERDQSTTKWYFDLKTDPEDFPKRHTAVFDIKPYSDSRTE